MEQEIAKFFWSLKDSLFFDIFSIISGKMYIAISSGILIIYSIVALKKKVIPFIIIAAIAIAASDIICYRLLKPAIKRPRPTVELNLNRSHATNNQNTSLKLKDYSMPSNHASNAFAFFIVYLLFVRKFWVILFANSILISASRVFIVKHYPTDVLAGILSGICIGVLIVYFFTKLEFILNIKRKNHKNTVSRID